MTLIDLLVLLVVFIIDRASPLPVGLLFWSLVSLIVVRILRGERL